MISESSHAFLNTPPGGNMDETVEFNLEKLLSMMPEKQEAFRASSININKVNPGKDDVNENMKSKEVVEQILAIEPGEATGNDTTISLDEADGVLVNPLGNQGPEPCSRALEETNPEVKQLNDNDDTQETYLQDSVEVNDDAEDERLLPEPPQTPVTSPAAGAKMKFQVVNNNGRMTLRVARSDQVSPQMRKSMVVSPTTPKSRSKPRRASDTGTPQRTKTTEKSIGGKTRNKVMSPRSSAIDSKASIASPNKPLMDLRHILKKYEKKKEPVPQQQEFEVGFYGSLSAIPFLTVNNDKASEKSTTEKDTKKDDRSCDSNSPKARTKAGTDSFNALEDEVIPEKPRLPTREEIVVIAEYDEEQLKLWKSMNALDSSLPRIERPQEMFPLRPGVRSEKKSASPRNSAVRAFSRPEDWLGHPEWNASQKSYRSITSDEQPDDDVLIMEPDE